MTFLELCQRARQECDASGTGPAAVTNQSGESKRFVGWVNSAWKKIQNKRGDAGGWKWLRKSFTFNTVASDDTYAYSDITDVATSQAITRWKDWYWRSFKAYKQSDGVGTEYPLIFMEWDPFRRLYKYGAQTASQPQHFSIDPGGQVVLGPAPDAIYVVSGDYQRSTQTLADDGDEPEMPEDFHELVVWEAMKFYARFESAPEVLVGSTIDGNQLWRDLERNQLPPMQWGDSLA